MIEPDVPADEAARLAVLRSLDLLDTEREERFDRITRLAAQVMGVPMCVISLIDHDRQWFKSSVGMNVDATERRVSFCGHTILDTAPFIVEDAATDERFHDNPLVTCAPNIRFYAGVPIETGGHHIGALCVLDTHPRAFTADDATTLRGFVELVEHEVRQIDTQRLREMNDRTVSALKRSERLHQSVVDAMSDGIVVQDASGAIIGHNPAACVLLGLSPDEMAGRTSTDPRWRAVDTNGRPLPGLEHPPMVTLATGERCEQVLMGIHTPDAELRWLSLTCDPLTDDRGQLWGVVTVFSDVTRQRATERAKSEFLSIISHELRTPLTSIRGSLGLLASGRIGLDHPQGRQMLDIAVDNTERLSRLIADILDLERIENGHLHLTQGDTSVRALLESARRSMAGLAAAAGQRLVVEGDDGAVWVDSDRIAQVMTNLMSNAIKFSEPGSLIRLVAVRHETTIEIQVVDQGCGIPADKLERIFGRFEQVDASDSRDHGGTGIGLTICRQLVRQHGGDIGVESSPGNGSTFSFTLPLLDAPVHAGTDSRPSPIGVGAVMS